MRLVETFKAIFGSKDAEPRVIFGPIPDDAKIESFENVWDATNPYVEVTYRPRLEDGSFGERCIGFEDRPPALVLQRRLTASKTWQR